MKARQLIPLDVLAKRLGLPLAYMRRLARSGRIPSLNVSGRLRFDLDLVYEALLRMSCEETNTRTQRPEAVTAS